MPSSLIMTIAEALSKKFVGQEGLKELKTRLDKKVDSVPGKGLSTNDFDAAAKTKLEGIENEAQKNKINQVKMNGTEVTPDETGAVDLKVEDLIEGDLTGYLKTEDAERDYQTKSDMSNYYDKTAADAQFTTEAELTEKLGEYTNTETLKQDYYDKTGADAKFIDQEELTAATQDFVTAQDIAEAINGIAEFTQEETAQILDGTYPEA